MDLAASMARNYGFATRAQLRADGVTDYELTKLLRSGALVPIGRSYVAEPGANRDLMRAVQMGARLACVSAAKRRGLWVIDDGRFHVTPRTLNSRFTPDERTPPARLHWTRNRVDPAADRIPIESSRSMLMHLADCQPLESAVASFDSALNQGLIAREELELLASAHGKGLAKVLPHCSSLADSGLETVTRLRLTWAGIACREQVKLYGHRVDLVIGQRLVVQLDGRQHLTDPVQLERDRAHDRLLRRLGYTVLRFGYADVMHRWEATFAEITALIAQRAHLWP